jgi:uncharacterized protein involved in exopolysaccharide biosynthesis
MKTTTTAEPLAETAQLLLKEGKRRLVGLTGIFVAIALIALVIGITRPKRWDASALILAENANIIQPLMQGRAVPTPIADQVGVLNQIVMRRRILREVANFGGFITGKEAPAEEERLLNRLKERIKIDTPRPEIVRISYYDRDPVLAARIANKLAEIYVREGTSAKERESKEAFEFIDKRVGEYAQKLTEAHEAVLAYYREHGAPTTAVAAAVNAAAPAAPNAPRAVAGAAPAAPAPVRRVAPPPESRAAEDQINQRINQLQGQLDQLLGKYTEQHPDVVRVRRDLNNAKEELRTAMDARMARERAAMESADALDDEVIQAARAQVRRTGGAASAAPAAAGTRPAQQIGGTIFPPMVGGVMGPYGAQGDPEMRGVGQDATLSELLRRYEANRDVYQDMLKRREAARVSMDLDAEHRGLSMRVQEPAEVPATASSLRFLYVGLISLGIAAAVPAALLVGIVKLDGRLRSERQVELAKVPLLITIPAAELPGEQSRGRSRTIMAVLMVVGVCAVYLATFLVKLKMGLS